LRLFTAFVLKVSRLIYLDVSKCWAIPVKGVVKVFLFFAELVSEIYGMVGYEIFMGI
jgi:hypothetical protein